MLAKYELLAQKRDVLYKYLLDIMKPYFQRCSRFILRLIIEIRLSILKAQLSVKVSGFLLMPGEDDAFGLLQSKLDLQALQHMQPVLYDHFRFEI